MIANKVFLWNEEIKVCNSEDYPQGVLLGLFSPFSNNNFKNVEVEGKNLRKKISFRKSELEVMCNILEEGLLKNFEVSLYGGEDNGKAYSDFESNQLGLFWL